jgi:hypothetical protein
MSQPLPKGALDGVTVLMSTSGQSCDQACKAQSRRCSSAHLELLNTCDRLREQVTAAPQPQPPNCQTLAAVRARPGPASRPAPPPAPRWRAWSWLLRLRAFPPTLNPAPPPAPQVACEAGCLVEPHQGYFPGYVDGGAPKQQRPAMCLASGSGSAKPACDAQEGGVARLCACA